MRLPKDVNEIENLTFHVEEPYVFMKNASLKNEKLRVKRFSRGSFLILLHVSTRLFSKQNSIGHFSGNFQI